MKQGMVFSLVCAVALAAAGLPAAASVASSSSIGMVAFISGGLTRQPWKGKAEAARVRDHLLNQDQLTTRRRQKAMLSFVDRTELYLNERTAITLAATNLTRLQQGEVRVVDRPGSNIRVQTASTSASAIGTNWDVRIERGTRVVGYRNFPPGTEIVSVVTGAVVVANKRGTQTVHAGEWTLVAPGKAPTKPTHHNAAQDIGWTDGLP